LYYAKARFYHPGTGRFISPDPAGQFFSPYSYGGGMPHIGIDPTGQWFGWDDLAVAAIGFTIGYIATGDWEQALIYDSVD